MPAGVLSIAHRQGTYVVLEAELPGSPVHPVGIFLIDPETDKGYLRLRERFDDLTDDTEVLDLLAEDMSTKAAEMGAFAYLASLEDSLSNVLRVSERRTVAVDSFKRRLEHLFEMNVGHIELQPYRTHLPLYSLAAAAGALGNDEVPEYEDWAPAPDGMRLSEDMFVAHVEGRSMEPLIRDGSLNIFRRNVVGSRQNKIVLIERFGSLEGSARYSVKKYQSRKSYDGEGNWAHEAVSFIPLNPEFEAWSPNDPDEFRIVAEWVSSLE